MKSRQRKRRLDGELTFRNFFVRNPAASDKCRKTLSSQSTPGREGYRGVSWELWKGINNR